MSEEDRGTAGVSDAPEWIQQLESLPQRRLFQVILFTWQTQYYQCNVQR